MVARSKKVAYFAHLEECLNKYPRAFLVDADFVGSKQISDIRIALRGKAELVFGKNTMIRRCIRNLCADGEHPAWESIIPYMVGNIGFVFTTGDLEVVEEVIKEYVKPAAAKAGVIAPCSCMIPKGPTGLDPAQTSFFQALNIATKINKHLESSVSNLKECRSFSHEELNGIVRKMSQLFSAERLFNGVNAAPQVLPEGERNPQVFDRLGAARESRRQVLGEGPRLSPELKEVAHHDAHARPGQHEGG